MIKWEYDSPKQMYYRVTSACHGASITQKMLFDGSVVTDPNFKIVTTRAEKIPIYRKWWQFWEPKVVQYITREYTNHKDVQFRYFCDQCSKQCKDVWEFKHGKAR